MTRTSFNDLDYLATRLHARRSRMAEDDRLDTLCRNRNLLELSRTTHPGMEFPVTQDFQRRLVEDMAREISDCLKHLDGSAQHFVEWLLVRLQLENIKVLLRGFLNHVPPVELQPHLIALSGAAALDAAALMAAKSLEDFITQLPPEIACRRLRILAGNRNNIPNLFILESALDADHLQELLARTAALPKVEREIVNPMVFYEANAFEFMLVARGRFHFGLSSESLLPLRLRETGVNGKWFIQLLSAPDISSMAALGLGIIIDVMPSSRRSDGGHGQIDVAAIESLAWKRLLRLANHAFRRSHLGIGAVAGYFGVRRVEIANLITLSEGIRLGVDGSETRARMIARIEMEAAHV